MLPPPPPEAPPPVADTPIVVGFVFAIGAVVEARGNEPIMRDAEMHAASTPFDRRRNDGCRTGRHKHGSCFQAVCRAPPGAGAAASAARQAQMRLTGCDKTVPRWTAPV